MRTAWRCNVSRSVVGFTAIALAIGIGYVTAEQAIGNLPALTDSSGIWTHIGGAAVNEANPYSVAARHQRLLLPLGSAEGVVLEALTDGSGMALSGRCTYRISGPIQAARLFSFQAASINQEPPAAKSPLPYALHSDDMLFGPTGFSINAAVSAQTGNWLALPTQGDVVIRLRLYETSIANSAGMPSLKLPSIERVGCGDAR
jgi:hypothetical protein